MQLRIRAIVTLAALAALAGPATANPYETFIDVDNEEDLYDLQATGQIDDDTLEVLVELMQRGVDLNRAGREELYSLPNLSYGEVDAILEYRALSGWINDPIDLVVGGVLSQQKLEAIAAFLVVSDPTRALFSTDGWIRGQTRWSVEDEGAPPAALQMRLGTLQNLTVGVAATLSRNRLADVQFDPERNELSAVTADDRPYLAKYYVQWENDRWGVIAGTYRIGFGQRLTFDNTSLYTPNGFYHDDQLFRETALARACRESQGELGAAPCASNIYETPDYRWREGLMGVAAGLKKVDVGPGHLQAYGFASYQPRSIYQYEIFSPETCDDPSDDNPRDSNDRGCDAPYVYRRLDDPMEPTSRFSFSTLPDLYTEMLAGGNIAYALNRRSHIGVTGYGADVSWRPDGIALDFQEYSRLPYGGPFGAVGVDGSVGAGMFDFFAEAARSFDSMPDGEGGGFGALVRSVTTFKKQNELEASLRYYDEAFKNPYARPIAAPDEFEGARARDEAGARLRYTARVAKRLNLRGTADVWTAPSGGGTDTLLDGRSDLDLTDQYGVGLWGRYSTCLEVPADEEMEENEPLPCLGEKVQVTGRFRYTPAPPYSIVAQYRHDFLLELDQQDLSATLIGTVRPTDWLRARGRVRYLSEDISNDASLEESIWGYLDVGVRPRARDWLRVRYDMYVYLDDRDSTAERVPSPEHWLWLEYESRF